MTTSEVYGGIRQHRGWFEMTIDKALDKQGIVHEYEARSLSYADPKTQHRHIYTPDFTFPCSGVIIEAKGYLSKEDRKKHLLLKEQYPWLDFRFIFQNPMNKLRKQCKGTYGTWCKRHGFKYADGCVPDEWIGEIVDAQWVAHRGTQSELRAG